MPRVRGRKVQVLGDSLSSGASSPGGQLAQHLTAAGAQVRIDARVGRSAHNFYGREDHAAHLAAIRAWHPDLVVVILGTNDIGLSMAVDGREMAQLRDALAAGGADVWAFGPPSFAAGTREAQGAPAVVTMIRGVFRDRFLDLRPATATLVTSAYRTGDQVHFTAKGGAAAGERMADQLVHAQDGSTLAWALVAAAVAYLAF